MKTLIYVLLLFHISNLNAQSLKKKSDRGYYYKEFYYIDKTNNSKQGDYVKLSKRDTIAIGQFKDGNEIGKWKYYNNDCLFLSYDFDSDSILFIDPKYNIDSSYIIANGEIRLDKVDRPAIYLGYDNEIKDVLKSKFEVTNSQNFYIQNLWSDKSNWIGLVVAIIIDEFGAQDTVKIEYSESEFLSNSVLKELDQLNTKWIPAKKNGQAIKSAHIIHFNFVKAENINKLAFSSVNQDINLTRVNVIQEIDIDASLGYLRFTVSQILE